MTVAIVAGPVVMETPAGIERIDVKTVAQMLAALDTATASSDAVIMAAAHADFRPAPPETRKLKKTPGAAEQTLVL